MKKNPLIQQAEKIERHARQGSIDTRRTYKKSFRVFICWLDETYKLQHLKNVSNKHLQAFVEYQLDKGNKATYITKLLSAIRFYHDQVPGARYILTRDNAALGAPKREKPGDRAWTQEEYQHVKDKAGELKPWIRPVLALSHELGLRIHEVVRLYRVDVERAMANDFLTVKGKGGKVRELPLSPGARTELKKLKDVTARGARVFVPPDKKAHQVIREIQDFIREHRKEGQLTAHGLRYNYAQKKFQEAKKQGMTEKEAEGEVSKLLGHNRGEVTRGYASWD